MNHKVFLRCKSLGTLGEKATIFNITKKPKLRILKFNDNAYGTTKESISRFLDSTSQVLRFTSLFSQAKGETAPGAKTRGRQEVPW